VRLLSVATARRSRRAGERPRRGGGRPASAWLLVLTAVARDDLDDGGAAHFAAAASAVRRRLPAARVEVLVRTPGKRASLASVLGRRSDVFNHNIETVPRLFPRVRPQGRYRRSWRAGRGEGMRPIRLKSGSWSGWGRRTMRSGSVLADLRAGGDSSRWASTCAPRRSRAGGRNVRPEASGAGNGSARLGFLRVFGVFVRSPSRRGGLRHGALPHHGGGGVWGARSASPAHERARIHSAQRKTPLRRGAACSRACSSSFRSRSSPWLAGWRWLRFWSPRRRPSRPMASPRPTSPGRVLAGLVYWTRRGRQYGASTWAGDRRMVICCAGLALSLRSSPSRRGWIRARPARCCVGRWPGGDESCAANTCATSRGAFSLQPAAVSGFIQIARTAVYGVRILFAACPRRLARSASEARRPRWIFGLDRDGGGGARDPRRVVLGQSWPGADASRSARPASIRQDEKWDRTAPSRT